MPTESSRHPRIPARIGDFHILRVLGEGGMGVVYEAEQDHPRRKVALKVVAAGQLTAEMQRRFEREMHVLGLLQHPGIAQIYQAGSVDIGDGPEPYFAMELVQGVSLLDHAREKRLTLQQKLELFARVCDAMQHAHSKGVVHRDLKPGNILVVTEDDTSRAFAGGATSASTARLDPLAHAGQPKILDFGVARLTESDLSATTIQTQVGELLGTVQYMSPEQVDGDSARIDSRSDVYSLGVIGYELACGRLPYELDGTSVLEALRIIREDAPTSIGSIDRTLRGDVETIFAKALEKDRAQRYATAADMAADVRRFLRHEPIVARPPSTLYQLRKFAARNRVLVGGVVAVFLALVAGLIGTGMGFVEARKNERIAREKGEEAHLRAEDALRSRDDANRARDEADKARDEATRSRDEATRSRDEATRARAAADASAAEAEAINEFLVNDMLGSVNPHVAKGRKITLEEVLENARAHADAAFESQPLLAARLHWTLGEIEFHLGRFDEAERHFRTAWNARREKLGTHDDTTLEAEIELGRALSELGRADEANALVNVVVEARRSSGGGKHLVTALITLGQARKFGGDVAGAQECYDEALEIAESLPPGSEARPTTLPTLLADRASIYVERGLMDDARRDYERSLELFRKLYGDLHPDVARVTAMLGNVARFQGRLDEAKKTLETVLEMQRKLFTKDHTDTARTLSLLGTVAHTRGDYAQAESRIREAIAMRSALESFDPADIATDRIKLAEILNSLTRFEEASAEAEKGLAELERHPEQHEDETARALFTLALARRGTQDDAGAAEAGERSLEMRRRLKVSDPRELLQSMSLVAQIRHNAKQYDEAEKLYREVLELYVKVEGPRSVNVAIGHSNLGQLLLDRERLDDAEKSLRESVEVAALALAPDHPTLAALRYHLARALHAAHKDVEAADELRTALDVQRKRLPPGHNATMSTLVVLGDALTDSGRAEEAEPLLREAVESRRSSAGPKTIRFAASASALGACLVAQGRFDEAESILIESHDAWIASKGDAKHVARSAQHLAELYEKLGRADEAARWRKEMVDAH